MKIKRSVCVLFLVLTLLLGMIPMTALSVSASEEKAVIPTITVQPNSGKTSLNQDLTIRWETNFAVKKYNIYKGGTYIKSTSISNASQRSFTDSLPESTQDYTIRCFYGTGSSDYIVSDPIRITTDKRQIIKQPYGGKAALDGAFTVSWDTNFALVRYAVYEGSTYISQEAVSDDSQRSFTCSLKASSKNYTIRCYYGTGSGDYLSTDAFNINEDYRMLTKQPTGGYAAKGSDLAVSWETNFPLVKYALYEGDSLKETTEVSESSIRSFTMSIPSSAKNYTIRCYYGSGSSDYVASDAFIITDSEKALVIQPSGGRAEIDKKLSITWKTNFTVKKYIIYDGTSIQSETSVSDTSKRGFTSYLPASANSYKIRIYFGTGSSDYLDSNTFRVTQDKRVFVTEPSGGRAEISKNRAVNWKTNYTVKKYIIYNGSSVQSETDVSDTSKRSFSAYLPASANSYKIRLYFGTGSNDYLDSNTFRITQDKRMLTRQPSGGRAEISKNFAVNWSTNFTVKKYIIYQGSAVKSETEVSDTTKRSFSAYLPAVSDAYSIRIFYGTDDSSYIDSTAFHVSEDDKQYTTQPAGGYAAPGKTINVNWYTNFTVRHYDIYQEGKLLNTLSISDTAKRSFSSSFKPSDKAYTIRSYFGTEDADYIESKPFTVSTLCTISFDANGGSGTMDNVTVLSINKYTLPKCTFTAPAGKVFDKWQIGNETFAAGQEVTFPGDSTVKALWHQHETVLIRQIDPTCTENGKKAYYTCSCGKNFEDAAATREITNISTWGVIKAKGHTPGETVQENVVPPTSTELGHCDEVVYCTVCGAELSRNTVSLGFINLSSVDKTTFKVGETVTVTGDAKGGKPPYTYLFQYKRSYATEWTNFGSGTSASLTPGAPGTFNIRAYVKDSEGTAVCKSLTVKVASDKDLTNLSTLEQTEVTVGKPVVIKAAAEGGMAPYTYVYQYKRSYATEWTSFGSGTTASFTPSAPGTFNIRVYVKDSNGTAVCKSLTAKVASDKELTNLSTLEQTEVTVGRPIVIKAAAEGGLAPYTYVYQYKRSYATEWTSFGSGTTASFTPSSPGSFNIRVYVKDCTGKAVCKSLNAKAVAASSGEALTNLSTLAASEVKSGSPVVVKGAASGGTAPYTFTYQYKRSYATEWTSFGSGSTASFTPSAPGSFNIRAYVKDSTGEVVCKSLTVKIT